MVYNDEFGVRETPGVGRRSWPVVKEKLAEAAITEVAELFDAAYPLNIHDDSKVKVALLRLEEGLSKDNVLAIYAQTKALVKDNVIGICAQTKQDPTRVLGNLTVEMKYNLRTLAAMDMVEEVLKPPLRLLAGGWDCMAGHRLWPQVRRKEYI